jgi:hypothetical protein
MTRASFDGFPAIILWKHALGRPPPQSTGRTARSSGWAAMG